MNAHQLIKQLVMFMCSMLPFLISAMDIVFVFDLECVNQRKV